MTFRCPKKLEDVQVQPMCTPECSRWQQINNGNPVPYFHDKAEWPGTNSFYTNITQNYDPELFFKDAIAFWETHSDRVLFIEVPNRTQALLVVQYPTARGSSQQIADALCVCDDNGEVCQAQANHSAVFTTQAPNELNYYREPIVKSYMNDDFMRQVYAHELGHVLGMGHQYEAGFESIMGDIDDFKQSISTFDIAELQRRHPDNCDLTQNRMTDESDEMNKSASAPHCPWCLAINHVNFHTIG